MIEVGFLSAHNPFDKRQFSGSVYYMRQALQAHSNVSLHILGGHRPPDLSPAGRIFARLRPPHSIKVDEITDTGLDVIVAPVASKLIAELGSRLNVPIIFITDATPQFLREFYSKDLPESRDRQEEIALRSAGHIVYSSQYMVNRALLEFKEISPEKLSSFPFGLNLDNALTEPPKKLPLDPVKLLFVGRDWYRKGGDIALATLDVLTTRGVSAYLTIIGCNPEVVQGRTDVRVYPYLDKTNPADLEKINDCYKNSHLFILPTRGDCTPMVVAEANSWGCPVLITRTGGIPSLMNEGRNGIMIDRNASAEKWADTVQDLISNSGNYNMLVQSSMQHCYENLTWSAWADNVVHLITTQIKDR